MDWLIPFGNDGLLHQEQELHQRVLALEGAFRFSDRSQLSVEAFNDIGCVHDPPDFLVVLKIAAQTGPVLLPGFDYLWIAGAPVGGELSAWP